MKSPDDMDSDRDDDDTKPNGKSRDDEDVMEADINAKLSSEELAKRAELAEGVKKMQVR